MHQVVKNLLARRNKKVPINDGRKIALILFGGVMCGVRGGATMVALQELGLAYAFDAIYTFSAGFPNASYLLTENAPIGCSIYYEDLTKKFFNPRRLWRIVDIKYVVEVMRKIKILDVKKLLKSKTKLFVGLFNAKTKAVEYIPINRLKPGQYYQILQAATSIPYLNPGYITIRGQKYKDTYSNQEYLEIILKAIDDGATDILIIYNYPNQIGGARKFPNHVYEISPKPQWQLSRFEMNSRRLERAAQQMGNYIKEIFGSKKPVKLNFSETKK